MSNVTAIVNGAGLSDPTAACEILPLVYEQLRKVAAARMANEAAGHTLQPTALVHEAWMRLTDIDPNTPFANRAHFFSAAADAMRCVLIDRARRKFAIKRGGGGRHVNLDNVEIALDADHDTVLLVSEALDELAREEPKAAAIVKLRFFAGLTLDEAGEVLGFTERTAKRHWAFARAWLYEAIKTAVAE